MLTNLLIADQSEAEEVSRESHQSARWPCLEFSGLDNAKFSALAAALGAPEDAKALEGEECLIHMESKSGPWVFRLPDGLTTSLAQLKDQEMGGVAERWVAHEELAYDGWSASDVTPGLAILRDFAGKAITNQKSLLLWMAV